MENPDNIVRIYKIVDNTNGNVYIGSTKQSICNRVARHRNYMNNEGEYCSSSIVLKNKDYHYGQIDYCHKDERKELEQFYINSTENCINYKKLNFNKSEWAKQKVKCECGCEINRNSWNKHRNTLKHQIKMQNIFEKQS
jgi:hypothetical protein